VILHERQGTIPTIRLTGKLIKRREYFDEANETLEQLKMLIGKENALKVYKLFEGENIYFPKRIGLAELHNQIYAELQEGKNYGELARK
jgi:Mor family transcriptional regulator